VWRLYDGGGRRLFVLRWRRCPALRGTEVVVLIIYLQSMKADKTNLYAYNKNLQPFANKLRKTMTKAEACLWKYALRARGIKGYQFRRERPVLNYIADFMCMDLKLIIEVDGLTHHWEETYVKDEKKDKDLKEAGFTILRFTDDEVLKNMVEAVAGIEKTIEEIESTKQPPSVTS
jgi:very-short-patch-repair endonuclease